MFRHVSSNRLLLLVLIGFCSCAVPGVLSLAQSSPSSWSTKDVVSKVAVAGATGRTGRLVVKELLNRDVPVVALVRNLGRAQEVFGDLNDDRLNLVPCDLTQSDQVESAMSDCDAAIWCATGFSDTPEVSPLEKIKRLLGYAVAPRQSVDVAGLPLVCQSLKTTVPNEKGLPKLVMMSSAGVTRPSWEDDKKAMFPGAADIPIVRLNPFDILNYKKESEEKLRESGVDYCIVRPCGLNDKWPIGSRPVFSQGDVAVGRIHRQDVATVLVDVLGTPEATGKTFEVIGVAGYPPPEEGIGSILARLALDSADPPSLETVRATYHLAQQLLPGEKQDSAALAMGQTYEQLDKGETGRLGKRGEEKLGDINIQREPVLK